MIEHPQYLYGNMERPTIDDGALFHYTRFEKFMKILETMTLRSSPLFRMNDLNEANIDELDWDVDYLQMIETKRYVKEMCSVICFTKNYKIGKYCQEGSNHPALWAHYADDSNGVCLVLDKHALNDINKNRLKGIFHKTESVKYCQWCAPNNRIMDDYVSNPSLFVRKNYKELFFKKHVDWKYEKEVRFLAESPEVILNIKGAIKYIILGERLSKDEEKLQKLISQIITPGTQSYRYLITASFAEMRSSPFGYFTGQADYVIERVMTNMSKLSNDYLGWEEALFSR